MAKWNSLERDFISEMRWNEWTGRKMRWDENDEMDEMANEMDEMANEMDEMANEME